MGKVLDYQDSVEKMYFRGTVWKRCVSESAYKIWSAQFQHQRVVSTLWINIEVMVIQH